MRISKVDPAHRSATQLIAALKRGEYSAVELLEQTIQRIERLDGRINAIVVRYFERARAAAEESDRSLKSGDDRPLLGLPIRERVLQCRRLADYMGFPQARDFVPAEDAVVVQRLRSAGAIVIGKTNIPNGISDWQSFNAIYGTTNNPWDLSRSAGGSSGGSAAALASGFVPLEVGSDLRGSIRVPAHYCGV